MAAAEDFGFELDPAALEPRLKNKKPPKPEYVKLTVNVTVHQFEDMKSRADENQIPMTTLMRRSVTVFRQLNTLLEDNPNVRLELEPGVSIPFDILPGLGKNPW